MFHFFEPSVPEISVDDLKKAMEAREDFVLLDVRTPGEVARGHIAGSINLPLDELDRKITSVVPDKTKTVYVYCLSGNRSASAVETMMGMGYANAKNVTHGMLGWRAHYYPEV